MWISTDYLYIYQYWLPVYGSTQLDSVWLKIDCQYVIQHKLPVVDQHRLAICRSAEITRMWIHTDCLCVDLYKFPICGSINCLYVDQYRLSIYKATSLWVDQFPYLSLLSSISSLTRSDISIDVCVQRRLGQLVKSTTFVACHNKFVTAVLRWKPH